MAIKDFVYSHPVFSTDELLAVCGNNQTNKNLLSRLSKAGLLEGYRGVWWRTDLQIEPLEVISRMYPDFCLCYHTALEAMGVAHSVFPNYISFTHDGPKKTLNIQGTVCVAYSRTPSEKSTYEHFRGVECKRWKAKTIVYECLNHPTRAGGVEEVIRSLVAYLADPDLTIGLIETAPTKALAAKLCLIAEFNKLVPTGMLDSYSATIGTGTYYLSDLKHDLIAGRTDHAFNTRWRTYYPTDIGNWT